ncbi:hypothetical protein [Dictyobacter formicarum]|uniref:hypothetical protein n=1 Tax=Dictyobacter formicarum TaxID=2778368 RepID=UPI001915544D|nr:hypothetical protein [Dictyobacter formicarum]
MTHEALQTHTLQPGQRVRLEMEARAGEQRVEKGQATTHQQLQELNGAMASPSRRSVPSSSRIAERAPQRDPVGERANSANCAGYLDHLFKNRRRALGQSLVAHLVFTKRGMEQEHRGQVNFCLLNTESLFWQPSKEKMRSLRRWKENRTGKTENTSGP